MTPNKIQYVFIFEGIHMSAYNIDYALCNSDFALCMSKFIKNKG